MIQNKYALCSLLAILFLRFNLLAIDPEDTRLMQQPAISESHIAFVYAEDIWVANRDGSQPRRLTVDEGVESNPVFSPDGSMVAFSAAYDGNTDVFIVPTRGGVPQRLTWHPDGDYTLGFTPDGRGVLFASQRYVHTNRYLQFFTVPIEGGFPTQLIIPNGHKASYSPDGEQMAYTPIYESFNQWKNYRGGTISKIWVFSFDDYATVEIPKPVGGCNDTDPVWLGDKIYFRSDRNGEFNLFSYDPGSQEIAQLTQYDNYPVLAMKGHANTLIFEQEGYLHTFDVESSETQKLTIGIATDLPELRPRYVDGFKYIRSANVSPSGVRVVMDFRGDIMTIPAQKGDPLNLTKTPGVHEKYPAWSPDGKSIAYFSDASGEYALHIHPANGKSEPKAFSLSGSGFYAHIHWSPDSKKLCWVDNGRTLYLLDLETEEVATIDQDERYVPGAFRDLWGDWSPDSRWISYTKIVSSNFEKVYLYSLEEKQSYSVTDGMSNAMNPVFDEGGEYLYMLASTDAGPVINWFDQSNQDMEMSQSIYLATLRKDIPSPFFKENEVEKVDSESDKGEERKAEEEKKSDEAEEEDNEEEKLEIEIEGIENRIVAVPLRAGKYSQLQAGKKGQFLYVESDDNGNGGMLNLYDLEKREAESLMEVAQYKVAAQKGNILYANNQSMGVVEMGAKPSGKKGPIDVSPLQVKIHPKEEWKQIFDEAWRVNRDYFYDPGMHGADWEGMKAKYEPFLDHLTCRSDLYRVIQWMCSELAVGHHRYYNPGERVNEPDRVPGGLLGADFTLENNRYRTSRIYGGLNWNPDLRSPLTEPGVNAQEGEYLLAVDGEEVTASDNLYSFFENKAGKIVSLTMGPNPDTTDSRTVEVVPIRDEYTLRNRYWVESNLKKVHEATDGRVAYVYVPNTAGAGHEYFKRYFFPQADKEAIIVDERYNGGGQLADYYIDILLRPYQAHWNFRYGKDLKSPSASIQGPKVMIIDETAGSGGDMLPWMFRKFEVGTLVGKRTWGGLVGILGFPEFIDGGLVTAPNLAIWTEEGFVVENEGVAPDVEVEQTPADVIEGKDPQLEKAIEIALEQLGENPPPISDRPPYPTRVRQ